MNTLKERIIEALKAEALEDTQVEFQDIVLLPTAIEVIEQAFAEIDPDVHVVFGASSHGRPFSVHNLPKDAVAIDNISEFFGKTETFLTTVGNGEITDQRPITEEEMAKFDEQAYDSLSAAETLKLAGEKRMIDISTKGSEPEKMHLEIKEVEQPALDRIATFALVAVLKNLSQVVSRALRGNAPTPFTLIGVNIPANSGYIFDRAAERLEELESLELQSKVDTERLKYIWANNEYCQDENISFEEFLKQTDSEIRNS